MTYSQPQYEQHYLKPEGGPRLFVQSLRPRGEARGAVAFIHGFNSASDYQLPFMNCLAEAGLACYAADYRGHGRSEGPKCHILDFDEYLQDADALVKHVAEREGSTPFLFGNSLGGLIGSLYAADPGRPDPKGLLVTAPFYEPAFKIPRLLQPVIKTLSRYYPSFRAPRRNPGQPPIVTMRWWTETRRAQKLLRRRINALKTPLLLLHGAEDSVACPRGAYERFTEAPSGDKNAGFLPGAGHEDLDPSWGPEWWETARRWLLERTDPVK